MRGLGGQQKQIKTISSQAISLAPIPPHAKADGMAKGTRNLYSTVLERLSDRDQSNKFKEVDTGDKVPAEEFRQGKDTIDRQ